REAMCNRVARLILGNRGIDAFNKLAIWKRRCRTEVAEFGIRPAMQRRAVIRIDHVAGRAAAGAIIARLIVRAEEIERRIEQPRLLQADEYGIGAVFRAQAAEREASAGAAGLFQPLRHADFGPKAPAALED